MKLKSFFLLIFVIICLSSCKKDEIEKEEEPELEIINCSIQERNFSDTDITLSLDDIQLSTITTINVVIDEFSFVNESVGYGLGSSFNATYGIWKTNDGGQVWQPIYTSGENRIIIDIQFLSTTEMFALVAELDSSGAKKFTLLYILHDQVVNEYSIPELTSGLYMSFINKDIGIIGTDSSQGKLFTTTDGGRNWKNQPISVSINDELMSYQQRIFLQTNQGIYVSTDCGTSWNERNRTTIRVKDIKNYKNDFYLMTNSEGLYKTDSTFASLTQQSDKVLKYWEVIDKNTIVGIDDNKIFLSNDEGRNWINKSIGTGSSGDRIRYCQWINPKTAYILDNYSGINRLTKIKINK